MNMAYVKVNWDSRKQMLIAYASAFIVGFFITSIILWWVQ
jgi:hypothetical protein